MQLISPLSKALDATNQAIDATKSSFRSGARSFAQARAGYNEQIQNFNKGLTDLKYQTDFNLNVLATNTQQFKDQQGQQLLAVQGQQMAQSASSGFAASSGSFLAVANNTADMAEQQLTNFQTAQSFRETALKYEAALQEDSYKQYITKAVNQRSQNDRAQNQFVSDISKQLQTQTDQRNKLESAKRDASRLINRGK